MKVPLKYLGPAVLTLFSHGAWSAELYLNTFLGPNPLKDIEVELDGKTVGSTDERGAVSAELDGGPHLVRVLEQGAVLAEYRLELAPGESADLSITFTNFEQPPEITVAKYDASQTVGGAPGVVEGIVTDADGAPIAGATVRLDPVGVEAATDENGAFRVEAPRGLYVLGVRHPGYEAVRQENFRVVANIGVAANVTLSSAASMTETGAGDGSAIEEIIVVGSYKRAAKPVDVERFSVAVTDAISVEELLRAGDSDVGASLKRIVGVAVTGGRYAVVRGLDGRYIASTLNGNLLPSTDPFRRDVQLDLFPSEILGGIEIQKSFTADVPGDTTGGIIKIATKDMPSEYVNSLSFSLGYTTGVTGEDLATYEGSDSDVYGYDDGLRALPGAVNAATNGGLDFSICQTDTQTDCVSQAEAARLASLLPNIYNPKTQTAGPNYRLSYVLGNVFERDSGLIGLYGTASYDRSAQSRQDAFIDDVDTRSDYVRDAFNTALSAYFVAGFESNGGWTASSKTLLLRDSEDTTESEAGTNKREDTTFRRVLLEWEERQLWAQQFQGSVPLFETHHLDWRAGVSQTTRYSPDRRTYFYQGGLLVVPSVERSYSDLTENGIDFGLDYALPLVFSEAINTNFKFGALYNNRERDNELVRLGFLLKDANAVNLGDDIETLLTPENFASDAFRLRATSTDTDSYSATQESIAGYLSTETNLGEAWTLIAGLREDDFTQDLNFPNSGAAPVTLESNKRLPSVSTIYRLGDDWQFRLGYSKTISRPNITELAPSRFYDENGREYVGCSTCTPSDIDNYDFRTEYYFNRTDSASLALFWKEIGDPLERSVADGSGSATNALTFRNNLSATVSGVEMDASKSFLFGEAHSLSVSGNLAFIDSEITLDDVGQRLELEDSRALQGQSPFLANLQFGYDHFATSQKVTMVVNYFEDRIDIVARKPNPVIYEAARATVNLTYEKELANRSKLSLKIKNLLDEKTQYLQDGKVIESYRKGLEARLGYAYPF